MEGNNKAMRDVLVDVYNTLEKLQLYALHIKDTTLVRAFRNRLCHAKSVIDTALAEPGRNCDMGTPEEQAKRMDAYCASHGERIDGSWRCDNCPLCSIHRCGLAWAQMPYMTEKGGAK